MEVVVGAGFKTVNVCVFEVPPPGNGFTTVSESVPALAISDARIATVSWLAETNVVVRNAPFQ